MSWTNPLPMRMGGKSRVRLRDLYAMAVGASGSLLAGDDGTETDLENRVIARMIVLGFRAARSRALQGDPLRLSEHARLVKYPDGTTEVVSPLVRWERILRLRPSPSATVTERRRAVAERRGMSGIADRQTLVALIERVLAPMLTTVTFVRAADLTFSTCAWFGGANTAALPGDTDATQWYSEAGGLRISYLRNGLTVLEAQAKASILRVVLDDTLPAHATFLIQDDT